MYSKYAVHLAVLLHGALKRTLNELSNHLNGAFGGERWVAGPIVQVDSVHANKYFRLKRLDIVRPAIGLQLMASYPRNFLLEVLLWGFHSLPRSAHRSAGQRISCLWVRCGPLLRACQVYSGVISCWRWKLLCRYCTIFNGCYHLSRESWMRCPCF